MWADDVPKLPGREGRNRQLAAFLTGLGGVIQPPPNSRKVLSCSRPETDSGFPSTAWQPSILGPQEHPEFKNCPAVAFFQQPCFSSLRPPASPKGTCEKGQSLVGKHGLCNSTSLFPETFLAPVLLLPSIFPSRKMSTRPSTLPSVCKLLLFKILTGTGLR